MAKLSKVNLQHPNGYVLGVAVLQGQGWQFLPQVAGRKPSRRYFQTADASLPKWARKRLNEGCSFLAAEACDA